uniref:Proline-rich protein PRCC n=1 Tax=Heliothis virescens TaxID=7102 RepID=A0A2A4JM30_HELVI
MALVAYGNSDSSDYEDEGDCEDAPVVLLNNKPDSKHEPVVTKPATVDDDKVEDSQEDGPSLFNFLPQPSKKKPAVIEEDDEFLHKKEVANAPKPKAKITVPSLSDFKDVKNSTPMVKPKPSDKKSGLLSMLPQPRNGVKATTNSLIPHVLTKKPAPVKKESLPSPVKKPKVAATSLINEYSDDSDNEEVQNDFFSIHKPIELPDEELPLDIQPSIKTEPVAKRKGIEAFFKKEEDMDHMKMDPEYDDQSMDEQAAAGSSYTSYVAESSNSNDVELDEEAIMKLCGARGKRKREDIQIVDVNQAEVLANAREMMMKGLLDDTTKRVSASKKKGNEPTTQQRRKHQITYLAYQAKANEAELQNQWANNRMSKRQTQAKYGF